MAKNLASEERIQIIREGRDAKAHNHFLQYAPVWLVDDTPLPDKDGIMFEIVFLHPNYGWVNRRYFYDAVTDVLYHKGQKMVDEEETIEIQTTQDPYIERPGINTVLSYGG